MVSIIIQSRILYLASSQRTCTEASKTENHRCNHGVRCEIVSQLCAGLVNKYGMGAKSDCIIPLIHKGVKTCMEKMKYMQKNKGN